MISEEAQHAFSKIYNVSENPEYKLNIMVFNKRYEAPFRTDRTYSTYNEDFAKEWGTVNRFDEGKFAFLAINLPGEESLRVQFGFQFKQQQSCWEPCCFAWDSNSH